MAEVVWLVIAISVGVLTPVGEAGSLEACERQLIIVERTLPVENSVCLPKQAYEKWLGRMTDYQPLTPRS